MRWRVLFLVSAGLLCGCATVIKTSSQKVHVTSSPEGASVMVGGRAYETPADVMLKRSQPHTLNVVKPGYKPSSVSITSRFAPGWLLGNIILYVAAPVGVLVDLITGSANELVPGNIHAVLEPDTPQKDVGRKAPREPDVKPDRVFEEIQSPASPESPLQIAVAELTPLGVSKESAGALTEKLRASIVQTRYFRVVTRDQMSAILKEQQFQRSVCNDTDCLIEMGKQLAVQKIIGGSVGLVGHTYTLSLLMIDVETGLVEQSVNEDLAGSEDSLLGLVRYLGRKLVRDYAERGRK